MALVPLLFHCVGAFLTVPCGLMMLFSANGEQVKYDAGRVALKLPHVMLNFFAGVVHLTVVSHEMSSVFFVLAIVQDCTELSPQLSDLFEIHFGVSAAAGFYVSILFWTACLWDPALIVPVDDILPPHLRLTPLAKRANLYAMVFGPSDPRPDCKWQKGVRTFMRYLHTFVPLLLFAEAALVRHLPRSWDLELRAMLMFVACYLAWNFSCWWLLKAPPYPLQKRIHDLGMNSAVVCYLGLAAFAISLLAYTCYLRRAGDIASWSLASIPVIYILWATSGLYPFHLRVAQFQHVDPAIILHGWDSIGVSPFEEKED